MAKLIDFFPMLGNQTDWAALDAAYPAWVQEMHATPQDAMFHSEGDVWTHTKMVVDALTSLPEWNQLDNTGRLVTWLGALLHDTGKPATTKFEGDRITSKGHSRRGAQDARVWLWREGLPWHIREAVCAMVTSHQNPFYTVLKEDAEHMVRQWSQTVRLDWLSIVTKADGTGRFTTPPQLKQDALDNVELFEMLLREKNIYGLGSSYADNYTWQKYLNSPHSCDPDFSIHRPIQGSKVFVLSGLPGMGKDYWARKHHPDLPMLSYDDMREEMGVSHGESVGEVIHAVWDQAKELLRTRSDFVWNATHLSQSMRKKALDLLWNYDAEVELVYLEVSQENVWRTQNRQRHSKAVPDKALDQLLWKWEPPTPREAENVSYWIDGVNQTHLYHQLLNLQPALSPQTVPDVM